MIGLIKLVTDQENQPHQFVGDPGGLLRETALPLLERLEWAGNIQDYDGTHDWDDCCPVCRARKDGPSPMFEHDETYAAGEHKEGCWLGALLSLARGQEGGQDD